MFPFALQGKFSCKKHLLYLHPAELLALLIFTFVTSRKNIIVRKLTSKIKGYLLYFL